MISPRPRARGKSPLKLRGVPLSPSSLRIYTMNLRNLRISLLSFATFRTFRNRCFAFRTFRNRCFAFRIFRGSKKLADISREHVRKHALKFQNSKTNSRFELQWHLSRNMHCKRYPKRVVLHYRGVKSMMLHYQTVLMPKFQVVIPHVRQTRNTAIRWPEDMPCQFCQFLVNWCQHGTRTDNSIH